MKTLTDGMILNEIDVENTIFLIGTGVFFFFAFVFIIVFLANPNKSKKLVIQCAIGMLIFVGLGCGSLYLVKFANDIKEKIIKRHLNMVQWKNLACVMIILNRMVI